MNPYVKLSLAALLPVLLSVVMYLLDKHTAFGKWNPKVKQVIYGVLFGALAIMGTEYGIKLDIATVNVRDAAPICAGLIFGAPAGIIAGVIGAVERYFAVYWGVGAYTQIACTVATAFSGLLAAILRKYMFDDKKPLWYYGLATGIVAEVLHMLMVFITNMDDARQAFTVVQICAIPMVSLTGASVMLSVLIVSLLGREKMHWKKEERKISQSFQRWLLVCIIVAFFLTSGFTYVLENGISIKQTDSLLSLNLTDVKKSIQETSDENLLSLTQRIAKEVEKNPSMSNEALQALCRTNEVSEINIVSRTGKIKYSTVESFVGFDMASGEQSAEFLVLVDGQKKQFVQEYRAMAIDDEVYRKYAGVALSDGGFVQVAYDAERFQKDISDRVLSEIRNRHIGENGYLVVVDSEFNVISSDAENWTRPSEKDIRPLEESVIEGTRFQAEVYGQECYCMYAETEGYYVISVLPVHEADFTRNMTVSITIFMEVVVFAALFILIYFLIKGTIVDNIRKINESLGEITDGNLDVKINVRSNEEFASLSDDINSTVVTLKHYIDEAAARIDKELEFARAIQSSALPRVFPPFPNRKEFDIYASMYTAKEVGGDFYDFYFVGEDRIAFLIADVSGKGIPAAMFMMTAKTLIKSLAETGMDVEEVFTKVNDRLCQNNDAGMFVTAWMGVLNIRTGLVTFANAGHNPPYIRRKDGTIEYLKSRAGLVLAGMEGIRYRRNEVQLMPGDKIFLYTDGVTEATNAETQLFEESRLESCLAAMDGTESVADVCKMVKAQVDAFVADAPQFDDITMLCLRFDGEAEA